MPAQKNSTLLVGKVRKNIVSRRTHSDGAKAVKKAKEGAPSQATDKRKFRFSLEWQVGNHNSLRLKEVLATEYDQEQCRSMFHLQRDQRWRRPALYASAGDAGLRRSVADSRRAQWSMEKSRHRRRSIGELGWADEWSGCAVDTLLVASLICSSV